MSQIVYAALLLCPLASVGGADAGETSSAPYGPGNEACGAPFADAPVFHLMNQHGCAENDPNGPVFDPVHGVVHHFYQDHLGAPPGGYGPVYGHFVSKDFIHWAEMPVAIWNGLDSSVWPPRVTPYDRRSIYTGSAVVVEGAGPGGRGPGVVQIYPGLCDAAAWPQCRTGVLLAQAVPADYAGDELLANWSKPSYNPIMENTQRDPSTPWKMPNGEWRMRTYDSMYGAASDADLLAGRWYELPMPAAFRTCECPSFYPLPGPTPGFEAAYREAERAGDLPTHVHKTSCGGDWWQLGTYDAGPPKSPGNFRPTAGWEDLFERRRMDAGNFYASKDNLYPDVAGGARRINWGWAMVPPKSAQTLPRAITFNAAARCLEQGPLEELEGLRGPMAAGLSGATLQGRMDLGLAAGVGKQSEVIATFELPPAPATFGIEFGGRGAAAGPGGTACQVAYTPPEEGSAAPFHGARVTCGGFNDTLRLVPSERTLEIRIFADHTFLEAYFQAGRVAMTAASPLSDSTGVALFSTEPVRVRGASVYPMKSMWVTPEAVRSAPRVYPAGEGEVYV